MIWLFFYASRIGNLNNGIGTLSQRIYSSFMTQQKTQIYKENNTVSSAYSFNLNSINVGKQKRGGDGGSPPASGVILFIGNNIK